MASSSGASSSQPKRVINMENPHKRDLTKIDLGTYAGDYNGGQFMLGMAEDSYLSDDESHLFPRKKDIEDRLFSSVEVKRDLLIGRFGKYYSNKLLRVKKICTRGGAVFYARDFTYLHDKSLYMGEKKTNINYNRMYQVLEFTGSYHGKSIDTKILVEKEHIYLIATKHPGEKWLVFKDYFEKIDLANSKEGACDSRYKGKTKGNYVGRGVLMSALYKYRYEDAVKKKQEALKCIIHHIAEAIRFKDAKYLACAAMDDGIPRLVDDLLVQFTNWDTDSEKIIRHKYPTSMIDRKRLDDCEKAELKKNNGMVLTAEENNSIRVWEELERQNNRTVDSIMCGHREEFSVKNQRYADAERKARSLKNNINDILRVKPKSCDLSEVELAQRRTRLLEEWKLSNTSSDIWDILAQALIDAEDDVAKLAVFHGNIIVLKADLSQTLSDLDVPFTIPKPDLEIFISTAKPKPP